MSLIAMAQVSAAARAEDLLFVKEIAPLLETRCLPCHNPQKFRGGLSLATLAEAQKGGDSGPAIVPRAADRSLVIKAVAGPEPAMPKQGTKLTTKEIDFLRRWINSGAAWPSGITLAAAKPKPRVGPDWWSLRPLDRPTLPAVREPNWVRTPIDLFILAAQETQGLRHAPEADRRTLIRRLTYDFHGLPPEPGEIEQFLNDPAPDAYERLVDRLLASPRYGERWGRHWLDVVHYGDTHGYDKDKRRDHAWRYRDYVIAAFNHDKPYEQFIREQLAGDVLYPGRPEGLIATGFIVAGPWDFVGHVELREGTVDKEKTRLIDRDDMVTTAISSFMSLTVHCARCHDHKFDPIPKREYYRLQAVFAGVDRGERPLTPSGPSGAKPAPGQPLTYAVVSHEPRPIYELNRGDVEQRGEMLSPGALSCVAGLDPDLHLAAAAPEGARRAALAEWIASRQNALTWRSIVNRVWHYHFGTGIVNTPNDFGWNGGRPSHPELLDWLAADFRASGQSLKRLHRLIVCSATYRQASTHDPAMARLDADNRYLWRTNRLRLDAESIRDAVLAVSGNLRQEMGGPGFELFRFKDDHSPIYDHTALDRIRSPSTWRRTVYRFTVRSVPNPFLECMDCADPNLLTPVRNTTLTALQALALLNDPFILQQAESFANRLRRLTPDPADQMTLAYQLAFGRPPTADERLDSLAYLQSFGLASLCRVLLNANEFLFID